jgi:large subunit ribosomal protein L9
MQIILLERIEKLGMIGDVVTVKDGYARNFLLPNKKASEAARKSRTAMPRRAMPPRRAPAMSKAAPPC